MSASMTAKDGSTLASRALRPAYLDDSGNPLGSDGAPTTPAAPTDPAAFQSPFSTETQSTRTTADAGAPPPAPATPSLGASIAAGTTVGAKGVAPAAFDPASWVTSALSSAQSTDDPNYWIGKIQADPNVQNAATRDSALAYWTQRINQGDGAAAVKAGTVSKFNDGSAAPAGAAVPASPGVVAPPSVGNDPALIAQLRAAISSRLLSDQAPVNETDANIAAPYTAAQNAADRQTQQARTAEAEREYANGGLNTDEMKQTNQQMAEANAGSLGTLKGNLIQQAYAQKQQDLQSLLSMALAAGDSASAQNIQAQLANLQATLTREGYGVTLATSAATQNANTIGAAL